jgi:hypothetical protein
MFGNLSLSAEARSSCQTSRRQEAIMTQISFFEVFAGWTPDLGIFAGLLTFVLFAVAAIALITMPVTLRAPTSHRRGQPARNSALLGGLNRPSRILGDARSVPETVAAEQP